MTDYTERQMALIDTHREINVDYDWWDCTYDDFTHDMEKVGIHVREMNFSGFWSQGDGASFIGYVSDNAKFLDAHSLTDDFPVIQRLLSHEGGFSISIERISGRHYVHENTVFAEISHADMFCHVLPSDEFRDHIISQWDSELEVEYDRLAETATGIIRDHCRDLYRSLEQEYDYLTSDDAVWEAIVANELDVIEEEENV